MRRNPRQPQHHLQPLCPRWLLFSSVAAQKGANLSAPQTATLRDFYIFSAIDFPLISGETPL